MWQFNTQTGANCAVHLAMPRFKLGAMDWHFAFSYDAWATRQLMDALAPLPEEAFTAEYIGAGMELGPAAPATAPTKGATSLRQQFWHLLSVMDRYRARLQGESLPDTPMESITSLTALRSYEAGVRDRLDALVRELPDLPMVRTIAHGTRIGVFHATVEGTLFHMLNHSTFHRGQIAGLLKSYGAEYPDTDIIIWLNLPME